MKWPRAFNGLLSIVALLLPLMAEPESHLQMAAPNAPLSPSAHVNFKIIIPKVLYLQVGDGSGRVLGPQVVTVISNGHNVSLNAAEHTAQASTRARSNVILSAAARKGIAQDAECRPAGQASRPLICTVSTP